MAFQDAQSTLDDIRRLQDRTHDELVRHAFALPYMLLMALGIFITYASTDLQSPWDDVVLLLGTGLYVGVIIVHTRAKLCRASVRPRSISTPLEMVFYLGWAFSPLLAFLASESAAEALDLPARGTLAAAVTAVTFVAAMPLTRRIAKAVMRQKNSRL
ncbi:hypothetical protein AB0395_36860 [Streptosporangium sp. NPDC051023]|uniref:hypothetical protein n=1 Tax=Streptosporangium sp. NPDC051023 TaxID=3155410 RepID=UPI00344E315B